MWYSPIPWLCVCKSEVLEVVLHAYIHTDASQTFDAVRVSLKWRPVWVFSFSIGAAGGHVAMSTGLQHQCC